MSAESSDSDWLFVAVVQFLAFTRYCFTSRLYCTIIIFFANAPFIVQYIAQYYQLLRHPRPISRNFEVISGVFLI